mgnify:CR=1 FL=1
MENELIEMITTFSLVGFALCTILNLVSLGVIKAFKLLNL